MEKLPELLHERAYIAMGSWHTHLAFHAHQGEHSEQSEHSWDAHSRSGARSVSTVGAKVASAGLAGTRGTFWRFP
jgi:hypothetical protein